MSRYAIWDKQTDIYFLTGKMITAEKFIEANPLYGLDTIKVVVSGEGVNGAFIQEFTSLKAVYKQRGCTFTDDMTDEEVLTAIEAFEDAANAPSTEPSTEERTASALEAIAAGQTTENAAALDILLTGEE